MKIGYIVSFIVLFSSQGFAQAPVIASRPTLPGVFKGGPLEGLGIGIVLDPLSGRKFKGLLPSAANVSPIATADKPAIDAFIKGHESIAKEPLRSFMEKGATLTQCMVQLQPCKYGMDGLAFGEHCSANTPYKMADGKIRVEWIYLGTLYYTSIIELHAQKIHGVVTSPAWPPLIVGAVSIRMQNG